MRIRISSLRRLGLFVCSFLALAPASYASEGSREESWPDRKLVSVDVSKSPSRLRSAIFSAFDVAASKSDGRIELLVSPEDLAVLVETGIELTVLQDDVYGDFFARKAKAAGGTAAARGVGNLSDYFNYSQMKADFESIATSHPSIATYLVIGTSLEGRELFGLKISDNPGVDEAEPEVLYCALHHSREPVSGECVRDFAHYLTDNYGSDPRVDSIVNGRELWLIPIVNPDGYVYVDTTDPFWRKNRRGGFGVDLNRNYGFQWGVDDLGSSSLMSSQIYRGTAPFSEPESQALRDLIDSREFAFSYDMHTYGDLYLPAYGYSAQLPEDLDVLYHHANQMASFGNGYRVGTPPLLLYLANGVSIDWAYGDRGQRPRVLSYTPEVGPSFYPNPTLIPDLVLENREPMLYLAEQAEDPYREFPPNAPVTTTESTVRITWTNENANGRNLPATYQVQELTDRSRITEAFELGTSAWTMDQFDLSTARSHSGLSSLRGGVNPGSVSTLEAKTGFAVESGDVLTFWTWYELEQDFDYAYVEVSTDNGVTYDVLAGSLTTASNSTGYNIGAGITGSSGGWIQGTFSLANYVGMEIRLRFQVLTDQAATLEGFYIDDIHPREIFGTKTTVGASVTGSSFDFPAGNTGTRFYRVRGTDDESQISEWSNRVQVDFGELSLVLTVSTSTPTVRAGERVVFTARLDNLSAIGSTLDYWIDAELPNGSPYPNNPLVPPRSRTVAALSSFERTARFRIPGRVEPNGPIRLYLRAGAFPIASLEDSFTFSVVP